MTKKLYTTPEEVFDTADCTHAELAKEFNLTSAELWRRLDSVNLEGMTHRQIESMLLAKVSNKIIAGNSGK